MTKAGATPVRKHDMHYWTQVAKRKFRNWDRIRVPYPLPSGDWKFDSGGFLADKVAGIIVKREIISYFRRDEEHDGKVSGEIKVYCKKGDGCLVIIDEKKKGVQTIKYNFPTKHKAFGFVEGYMIAHPFAEQTELGKVEEHGGDDSSVVSTMVSLDLASKGAGFSTFGI